MMLQEPAQATDAQHVMIGAANSVACEIIISLYVYSTHLSYPTSD